MAASSFDDSSTLISLHTVRELGVRVKRDEENTAWREVDMEHVLVAEETFDADRIWYDRQSLH
jgi:hypothetical protein